MPVEELEPVELGSSLTQIGRLAEESKNSLAEGLVDSYLEYLRISLSGNAISRQDALEVFHRGIQILSKKSLQGAL